MISDDLRTAVVDGDRVDPSRSTIRVVWGSTSGHTEYVADVLADVFRSNEPTHHVEAARAEVLQPSDLFDADLLVLASSTWNTGGVEGQLNPHMQQLLHKRDESQTLAGRQCACVGLGDHRYYYRARAADLLEQFVHDCSGRLAVPTLKIVDDPYGQESIIRDWGRQLMRNMDR